MHLKTLNLLLALFLLKQIGFSQNNGWKTISKDEMKKQMLITKNWNQSTSSYSVDITHISYEDYTSVLPYEKIKGYLHKSKNCYNSSVIGIQTIQNEKYKIYIDTSSQYIAITNAEIDLEAPLYETYSEAMLDQCKLIKMQEINGTKKLRLEFLSNSSISACELGINKDGSYNKIIIFYADAIKQDESDSDEKAKKPRVEIQFSNYILNPSYSSTEFSEQEYFTLGKTNLPTATPKFKSFKIQDQRIKPTKNGKKK